MIVVGKVEQQAEPEGACGHSSILAHKSPCEACDRSLVGKVDCLPSEQKPRMIAEEGWNRTSQKNHHLWESPVSRFTYVAMRQYLVFRIL